MSRQNQEIIYEKKVDRKTASEILNVSTRTVDRYLRRGKLSGEEINGRVLIDYEGLDLILKSRGVNTVTIPKTSKVPPKRVIKIEEIPEVKFSNAPNLDQNKNPEVYQKLFEELQLELKEKQERLEGANYRVGQLEGQLKESIPLIEYKKVLALEEGKREELEKLLVSFEKENHEIQSHLQLKQNEAVQLSRRLSEERLNKKIYLIILLILFILQPLWLIFPIK